MPRPNQTQPQAAQQAYDTLQRDTGTLGEVPGPYNQVQQLQTLVQQHVNSIEALQHELLQAYRRIFNY